jgi:hypothetical protein
VVDLHIIQRKKVTKIHDIQNERENLTSFAIYITKKRGGMLGNSEEKGGKIHDIQNERKNQAKRDFILNFA